VFLFFYFQKKTDIGFRDKQLLKDVCKMMRQRLVHNSFCQQIFYPYFSTATFLKRTLCCPWNLNTRRQCNIKMLSDSSRLFVMTPCNYMELYRYFGGPFYLHITTQC